MTAPLFDSPRYTRDFEAALMRMVAIRDAGGAPEPIRVPDLGPWTGAAAAGRGAA